MTNTIETSVLERYAAGRSQKDICGELGLSPGQTRDILRAAGYDTRGYRHLAASMVRVINILIDRQVCYQDIEAYCDISFDVIRTYARGDTISRNRRSRIYDVVSDKAYAFPEFAAFLRRYDAGESFSALADDLKLTDEQVYIMFYYLWSSNHREEHRRNLASRVRAQHAAGYSVAAIARRERVSYSVPRSLLRQGAM